MQIQSKYEVKKHVPKIDCCLKNDETAVKNTKIAINHPFLKLGV